MARGIAIAAGALCALLISASAALAAPPSNDDFAGALPLTVGQQLNATNLEATAENFEPVLAGSEADECTDPNSEPDCTASVWYSFEAPSTGEFTIETCDGGTELDTVLGLFTGPTIDALVKKGEDDNSPGCAGGFGEEGSRLSFSATSGELFHVVLDARTAEEGSFYIRAYAGGAQPRPEPETSIERDGSFSTAARTRNETPGVLSGPRYSASFALRSSQPGSGFECSLDGAGFASCPSVDSYDLAPGSSHAFAARATVAGQVDPTPAIERFTIAANPPSTFLTGGPSGSIPTQEASWEMASDTRENFGEPFFCGLDSEVGGTCEPKATFSEMCAGPHEFRAAAFDKSSLVDPTPVTATVTPATGPACAPPTVDPPTVMTLGATRAVVSFAVDGGGMGAKVRFDYGKTAAYGLFLREDDVEPSGGVSTFSLEVPFLEPATTYHFKVAVSTPLGTASTQDTTLTTKAAGGVVIPAISNGEPTVVGAHAASLPFAIDTKGESVKYQLFIAANAPAAPGSPQLALREDEISSGASVPQPRTIPVTDLDSSTTYHYRLAASTPGPEYGEVLGPEGSFTTGPKVETVIKRHFKLRRKNVKIGVLKRSSKKLRVRLVGLPPKSKVKVKLKVGGRKQTATRKANSRGRARLKVTLSKRIRKALHKSRVKKAIIRVTVSPPEDTPSSITIKKRLKGSKRHRS